MAIPSAVSMMMMDSELGILLLCQIIYSNFLYSVFLFFKFHLAPLLKYRITIVPSKGTKKTPRNSNIFNSLLPDNY